MRTRVFDLGQRVHITCNVHQAPGNCRHEQRERERETRLSATSVSHFLQQRCCDGKSRQECPGPSWRVIQHYSRPGLIRRVTHESQLSEPPDKEGRTTHTQEGFVYEFKSMIQKLVFGATDSFQLTFLRHELCIHSHISHSPPQSN